MASCGNNDSGEKAEDRREEGNRVSLTEGQMKNSGIQMGSVSLRLISSVLKANGRVDVPPQNVVSVSVPLGGYLRSTSLLPGMHISKGDILAVMEDQQYIQIQQDYLTAKAQLEYSESDYKRQATLNESKANSDKVFEQARAAFQTQKVLVHSLEEKLKLIGISPGKIKAENISRSINVYSPINGFVSAVNVNIGKYVNPSDVLFELVNPADIHLALNVFEKDLDKLSVGQQLMAYTNSKPEQKYPCTIILISRKLSDESSTKVHCHFEQYDKSLVPGMFMNAEIALKNSEVKTLPEEAIVRFENKQYVFAARKGLVFEMVEVVTGTSENGYTEISMDEKMNRDSFVTRGAYTLLMKLKNTAMD